MGSLVSDVGLNLKAYASKSILKEGIQIEGENAKAEKLEGFIRNLEVERAKIEVFRRELPLSVHLLSDVIEWLKEEVERCEKGGLVFEELMPMKSKFEEKGGAKVENDTKDNKMNWLSSVQLWSHEPQKDQNHETNLKFQNKPSQESTSGTVLQFENFSRKQERVETEMDLNLLSYKGLNAISINNSDCFANITIQSQQRKMRRSWSPELHRRFISALQHFGGAQVATPKQIREFMKVDGLTNDEVKSHLQKYRLHCRKTSQKEQQNYSSSVQSNCQSSSPTGPLQFSFRTGESCEIEFEE